MSKEKDRQKFVELAGKRVTRAIKDLKLVGNLSNKNNYDYTEQDVKRIYSALKNALEDMKSRFSSNTVSEEDVFKL